LAAQGAYFKFYLCTACYYFTWLLPCDDLNHNCNEAGTHKKMLQKENLLTMILLLAIFHIGFKNYPFWTSGLQHAKHAIESGYYDPKALLQETEFIGAVWYASMLLFIPLSICSIAILLILLFCNKVNTRQFWCGFILYSFNIILLMLTSDFIPWLLD